MKHPCSSEQFQLGNVYPGKWQTGWRLSIQVHSKALWSQGKLDCWETSHLPVTAEIRFFPWPCKGRVSDSVFCFVFLYFCSLIFGKSQGLSLAIHEDKTQALSSTSSRTSFSPKSYSVWYSTPVIPAFRRLRQEDDQSKTNLSYKSILVSKIS